MKRREAPITCTGCGSQISGSMPWRCGNCDFDNRRVELYSFLFKCQKCGSKPTAVACPQCGANIRLPGGHGPELVAMSIPVPKKTPPPEEDAPTRARREHAEEMDRLNRAIAKANKETELKKAQSPAPENPEASLQDALDKELKKELADGMHLENAFAKLEREVAEQYKNDEDNLEKARMYIKLMKERRIST